MLIPRPVVEKVVNKGGEFIPILGPAVKYGRKAIEVTKLSDPVTASTRAVGYLVTACSGPVIKYPALCLLWAGTGTIGIVSGSPIFIGSSLEFAAMILEEL